MARDDQEYLAGDERPQRAAYRKALRSRTTGDCEAGGVEVRYDEPEKEHIDELVAKAAWVHLERMGQNEWCLIVETDLEKVCLFLGAGRRANVEAREAWRDPAIATGNHAAMEPASRTRSAAPK